MLSYIGLIIILLILRASFLSKVVMKLVFINIIIITDGCLYIVFCRRK